MLFYTGGIITFVLQFHPDEICFMLQHTADW